MRRSSLWILGVAGLLVAGCTDYGSYEVTWQFVGASTGCGEHGVDSIRVIGTSTEGEREDVTALCTNGRLTHSVPVGTWTFSVHQLDVRGRLVDTLDENLEPVAPSATAEVTDGTTVTVDPATVELTPRPACSDGVDNDGDGRVDLDDLDCGADPNGTSESPVPAAKI